MDYEVCSEITLENNRSNCTQDYSPHQQGPDLDAVVVRKVRQPLFDLRHLRKFQVSHQIISTPAPPG